MKVNKVPFIKKWYDRLFTYRVFGNPKVETITPSPIIMEVEHGYIWKVTTIGGTHFWLPWLWEEVDILKIHPHLPNLSKSSPDALQLRTCWVTPSGMSAGRHGFEGLLFSLGWTVWICAKVKVFHMFHAGTWYEIHWKLEFLGVSKKVMNDSW